jgi:hypothetical protein
VLIMAACWGFVFDVLSSPSSLRLFVLFTLHLHIYTQIYIYSILLNTFPLNFHRESRLSLCWSPFDRSRIGHNVDEGYSSDHFVAIVPWHRWL